MSVCPKLGNFAVLPFAFPTLSGGVKGGKLGRSTEEKPKSTSKLNVSDTIPLPELKLLFLPGYVFAFYYFGFWAKEEAASC